MRRIIMFLIVLLVVGGIFVVPTSVEAVTYSPPVSISVGYGWSQVPGNSSGATGKGVLPVGVSAPIQEAYIAGQGVTVAPGADVIIVFDMTNVVYPQLAGDGYAFAMVVDYPGASLQYGYYGQYEWNHQYAGDSANELKWFRYQNSGVSTSTPITGMSGWYNVGVQQLDGTNRYYKYYYWYQNTTTMPVHLRYFVNGNNNTVFSTTSGDWYELGNNQAVAPLQNPLTKDYVLRWEASRSQPWYGYSLTNPYAYDMIIDVTTNSNDVANANHAEWEKQQLTGKVSFYSAATPLYTFWGNPGYLDMAAITGVGFNSFGLTDSRAKGRLWGQQYGKIHAVFTPVQAGYSIVYFDIDLAVAQGDGQLVHGVAGGGAYGSGETTPGTSTVLPTPVVGPSATDNNTMRGGGLNFQPLIQTGEAFRTKFPFSLPWDFQNMVNGFGSGTTVAPTFDISVNHPPIVFTYLVDLSMWDVIMPAVRGLELILFSLTLMFLFGKLSGGGGS